MLRNLPQLLERHRSNSIKTAVGIGLLSLMIPAFLYTTASPPTANSPAQAETEPPSKNPLAQFIHNSPTPPSPLQMISQPPHILEVEAKVIATPVEPTPEPVVTWQDNPNHCDTTSQWIAASPPFVCIEKFSQPAKQAVGKKVQISSARAEYTIFELLPGVSAALNSPYISGGTTLAGFDCSGLTQYLSKLRGYNIPRTAAGQIGALRHIPMSEARAGDIIGFNYGHVGMYLGGGKVVHALNPIQGVRITTMDDATTYNGFITALAVGH